MLDYKFQLSSLLISVISLIFGIFVTWIIITYKLIQGYPSIPVVPLVDIIIIVNVTNGIGWIFSKIFMLKIKDSI